MNTPPMNTLDLIELAVLDGLGMLERDEAAAFDAAFWAAPPATQERVLAEQARLAGLEGLLPDVTARPDMRSQVIAAVREALLADAVAKAAESDDEEDQGPLRIRASHGVNRVWRVGALAAAAASVAFGVAFGHATLRYNDLNRRFEGNGLVGGAIGTYGADWADMLLNPDQKQYVMFTPVDPTALIGAVIEYNDERKLSFLHCGNLPTIDKVEYALVLIDPNNQIGRTLRQFASTGSLTSQRFDDLALADGMRLALVSVSLVNGGMQIMATTTITI